METLKRLIREIHRRSLWQVLGVYGVTSWVVYQIVLALYEGLGLPDWVVPTALVLLLVGLPVVLATALVQDGRPGAGPARREAPARGSGTDFPGIELELSDGPEAGGVVESAEARVGAGPGEAGGAATGDPEDAGGADRGAAGASRAPLERIFTWRKAITGGVLAFALLGLATTGFMGMRAFGIGPVGSLVGKGVIDERERVVVAQFETATSDSVLAAVVTDAFRVDLAQSRLFQIVDRAEIERLLRLMERVPDARLDRSLAREAALRGGIGAVVAGRIATLGGRYVLTAELLAASDGSQLAAFDETASDSTELIEAVDRLADELRERAGESLKTIRASEPLAQVTTASLPALRKYTRGAAAVARGDCDSGMSLLDEAIALDSAFAMAYRRLAAGYTTCRPNRTRQLWALRQALEHQDRLTDWERYRVRGLYYLLTGEPRRAVSAHEALLELYPRDLGALNNLGVAYGFLGEYTASTEALARAVELGTRFRPAYSNLIGGQLALGDFAAAERTIAEFERRFPDDSRTVLRRARIAALRGDYDAAETILRELRDETSVTPRVVRASSTRSLGMFAATRGRLAEADRYLAEAARWFDENGSIPTALRVVSQAALLDVWVGGSPERAIERLRGALERHPLDSVPPADRPYLELAWAYAAAGAVDEARRLLDERAAEVDEEVRRGERYFEDVAPALIALAQERWDAAASALREAQRATHCGMCMLALVGYAYERAARPDSAVAAYERYLSTPGYGRVDASGLLGPAGDPQFLAFTHERLGELYEARGEPATAAEHYARFAELWRDADPELRPRVEAARRALERLTAEGARAPSASPRP